MKATLIHCVGLANENMRRHLVFGATELPHSREQSQVIERFERQRETECSRFGTIFRTGHTLHRLSYNVVIMAL
jgi:hypothetical protein